MLPADAKIALLSPSGWGNLGDMAILESLIRGVRRRLPQARLSAFTQNPRATAQAHQLKAGTLLGFSPPWFLVQEAEGGPPPWNLPRPCFVARGARCGKRRTSADSMAALRGCAAVVVAGGGQLDELYGGAAGQPWALLRWGLLARAVRARFLFLSVGTGELRSRSGRLMVRRALALAHYRSFRDEQSRALAGFPRLTAADPVVPDLAYALPLRVPPASRREALTVGLSPMTAGHPRLSPRPDAARYRRHVESFAALAEKLLSAGQRVLLFSTAGDTAALADVAAAVPAELRQRLSTVEPASVEALMAALAGVDLVVAARLHAVLLSHLAGKPVLAAAHERKVRALMDDTGQSRYCVELEQLDASAAAERLREMADGREQLAASIAQAVGRFRERVEAQYDSVFGAAAREQPAG